MSISQVYALLQSSAPQDDEAEANVRDKQVLFCGQTGAGEFVVPYTPFAY